MTGVRLRLLAVAAVVTVGAGMAAGCKVPTYTDVVFDGQGPQADELTPGVHAEPPGPQDASSPEELVTYFLQAAAGLPATARERVAEFIYPDQRDEWAPDRVLVVRAARPAVSLDGAVSLRVRVKGELTLEGYVEPATPVEIEYGFRVVDAADIADVAEVDDVPGDVGSRLYIVDPPQVMLLDESWGLNRYYEQQPVYFWDSADGDVLVPDLRWLPLTVPREQRPDLMLRWLMAGPSPWLKPTVSALPEGIDLNSRVPAPDGDVIPVDLTAPAGEADLDRLVAQLNWTLHAVTGGASVRLSIDGQRQETDSTRYQHANRAARTTPARYAVVDGVVRPFVEGRAEALPALPEDLNVEVRSAAATRDGQAAAVVRAEPDGRLRLVVLAVGQGGSPVESPVHTVMSRPVWLDPDHRVGLVVADGDLYRFTAEERPASVPIPTLDGTVTAVAAAPDGRRLALVAGGRLYGALIHPNGSVEKLRELPTTAEGVTQVAFGDENQLVFAGAEGNTVALYRMTVDGAYEKRLDVVRDGAVTHLVSHPTNARDNSGVVIMYEAGDRSYSYQVHGAQEIGADDLIGAAASGSPPRAPFFLE